MMDMLDMLIERIESKNDLILSVNHAGCGCYDEDATNELLRLAKIGQQMQWVSVKDRLPETIDGESEEIIVCDDVYQVITGVKYYSEDKVFADEFGDVWSIEEFVYWMNKPQPPKEDSR